ncbi:MAG: (R)-stereoselective amidase [Syntrophorhabdaceae bacterium PtaU1.Bin034]|jgi:predicted amidohydrolase|nr:MAG: (R)-stereoselective amidase [Syntrophorhabdaceae bacterium PtaU1.Bin034]
MDERLLIGIVHLNVRHGAVAENRASLLTRTEEAAERGARIIVAPELAVSGYSFEGMDEIAPYTEELTGETVTALSRIARRFGVCVCAGLAEHDRKTGIFYNSAVVLGPDGRLVARHRKHVAERRWSCPGQPSPASLFETPWGKVGVLICADSYYGLLPRSMALQGADLLLVCANWPPTGLDPREIWRARVLENGTGLVAANRTGLDRMMDCRTAPSFALAPDGAVLLDETAEDTRTFFVEYPLEGHRFPSRLREEMAAARCPRDYNAIALDSSGLDDFPGMWGLPASGLIEIRCLVPSPGPTPLPGMGDPSWAGESGIPRVLVLPPGIHGVPLQEIIRQSREGRTAMVTETRSPSGSALPALVSEGRLTCLSPDKNSVMVDFSPARIALVRSESLRHPEAAVALSKQGCDIIVSQAGHLDDDTRLLLGVKSLERAAVAVATPEGATICEPPEGHERWHETMLREPGVCAAVVDTARTRKKRFLDRVDLEVLLRR